MRLLALLFIFATTCLDASAIGNKTTDSLEQAVEAYQSALDEPERDQRVQLFRRAETLFGQTLEKQKLDSPQRPVAAELYINLGNAALGAEHLGAAVLAYRRCLSAEPKHRRARQNLEHARSLLPDWVPVPDDDTLSYGSLFDWIRVLPASDWFGLASVTFLITTLFLAAYLRTDAMVWRNLTIVFAILWITFLVWPVLGIRNDDSLAAIIVVPGTTARSADSINAPVRFSEPLPAGTELTILETRDDWIRVQMADSREAWLPASSVERVAANK